MDVPDNNPCGTLRGTSRIRPVRVRLAIDLARVRQDLAEGNHAALSGSGTTSVPDEHAVAGVDLFSRVVQARTRRAGSAGPPWASGSRARAITSSVSTTASPVTAVLGGS